MAERGREKKGDEKNDWSQRQEALESVGTQVSGRRTTGAAPFPCGCASLADRKAQAERETDRRRAIESRAPDRAEKCARGMCLSHLVAGGRPRPAGRDSASGERQTFMTALSARHLQPRELHCRRKKKQKGGPAAMRQARPGRGLGLGPVCASRTEPANFVRIL